MAAVGHRKCYSKKYASKAKMVRAFQIAGEWKYWHKHYSYQKTFAYRMWVTNERNLYFAFHSKYIKRAITKFNTFVKNRFMQNKLLIALVK